MSSEAKCSKVKLQQLNSPVNVVAALVFRMAQHGWYNVYSSYH